MFPSRPPPDLRDRDQGLSLELLGLEFRGLRVLRAHGMRALGLTACGGNFQRQVQDLLTEGQRTTRKNP